MKQLHLTLFAALFMLATLSLTSSSAQAQVTTPQVSPYAKVSEQLGLTNVTIKYSRPGVNGREIWGKLVPYGHASPFPNFGSGNPVPWRAGANENTTIWFEHDVLVEGQKLAAGKYGLHMVPSETDWTIIFSHNTESWGSFFYDENEDALRVTVTPVEAPHTERLAYEFTDHDGIGKAAIALRWEKMKIPFRVEVDHMQDVVMNSLRNELRSRGGFGFQGYTQAANYALNNNYLDDAATWANVAVQRNKSFNTLNLKSRILTAQGNTAEAEAVMTEAMEVANENQLNAYGYQLMGQNKMDQALAVFKMNVKRHPESWNPKDSLAECYAKMGDAKNAKKYYKEALKKLPETDTSNRDRINGVLASM